MAVLAQPFQGYVSTAEVFISHNISACMYYADYPLIECKLYWLYTLITTTGGQVSFSVAESGTALSRGTIYYTLDLLKACHLRRASSICSNARIRRTSTIG